MTVTHFIFCSFCLFLFCFLALSYFGGTQPTHLLFTVYYFHSTPKPRTEGILPVALTLWSLQYLLYCHRLWEQELGTDPSLRSMAFFSS